jgi:MerR family transcriptional regulator, light-induced transcriptional regulator
MVQSLRLTADRGAPAGDPSGHRRPPSPEEHSDPNDAAACSGPDDVGRARLRLLVSTVESQVIPRLVLAHRPLPAAASDGAAEHVYEDDVRACVELLLGPGAGSVAMFADGLLARGLSLDALYLGVFAPAARELGRMWEQDECSFTDVTIALGRLQQSLRTFSARFRPEFIDGEPWRRALFASVPGEQHTFGLAMVSQYFLRAGWDATLVQGRSDVELMRLVQSERVALIGFSMSGAAHAPVLRSLIARLRTASRNTALKVLVGGVVFTRCPGLVSEVGADGSAGDAQQAVNLAQRLVL